MIYSVSTVTLATVITVPCQHGESLSVGGVSDTASAQLDYEVLFVDGAGNLVGSTGPQTLVCGSTANWPVTTPPTLFRGDPVIAGDQAFHITGITAFITISRISPKSAGPPPVNSVWTISAAVAYPVGVTIPS